MAAAAAAALFFFSLALFSSFFCCSLSANNTTSTTAATVTDQPVLCPSDWEINASREKCFRYFENSYSYDKAESFCADHKGHLASVASVDDLTLIRKLCVNSSGGCWLGGRHLNSTSGYIWKWNDNITSWNRFVYGEPFLLNCSSKTCNITRDACTLLTSSHVAIAGEICDSPHHFICMTSKDNDICHRKICHKEYLIILAVASVLILTTMLAIVVWLLIFRRTKKRRKSRRVSSPSSSALVPPTWRLFTCDEIRQITKNFSEANRLVGDAKTGGTYSGLLADGSRVAVKRLKRAGLQRKKEFYSEIGRISRLHHTNLVAVKGCCYDHGDRYIVYEFVANGPLDRWLYHVRRGGRCLDWQMRIKIAVSLAQGIAFLHDKVKPHVVHRDIRASNVLLDEDFGAHLMGVGLSKFVPWEVMHERTVMAGTYGYLAPEFVYRNELTTKSDVYSFGVLLLELISGRRPAQAVESVGWQSIFEWATPLVQSHQYIELLDPVISDIPEVGMVQKVVDLVYTCTQHVPSVRPRMSYVVHQLQQLGPWTSEERSSPTSCIQ